MTQRDLQAFSYELLLLCSPARLPLEPQTLGQALAIFSLNNGVLIEKASPFCAANCATHAICANALANHFGEVAPHLRHNLAQTLARLLCCPLPLLELCGVQTPGEIRQLCNVTIEQAQAVQALLKKRRHQRPAYSLPEQRLIEHFMPFIWTYANRRLGAAALELHRLDAVVCWEE